MAADEAQAVKRHTPKRSAPMPPAPSAPVVGPRPQARPSVRTPELVDSMLEHIAGGDTLLSWCRIVGHPDASTVYKWIETDAVLAARWVKARMSGFDALAMQCLQIADEPDMVVEESVTYDANGKVVTRTESRKDNVASKKVRIWTRLQLLARWDPKRYGEKLGIGQAEGLDPMQVMSHAERIERIKTILASAGAIGAGGGIPPALLSAHHDTQSNTQAQDQAAPQDEDDEGED